MPERRTNWADVRTRLKTLQPDMVDPPGAPERDPRAFTTTFGEKGTNVFRREFDPEGFDQWGVNEEGYTREWMFTPKVDYLDITSRAGKVPNSRAPTVHKDDKGGKVLEIFNPKADSVQDEAGTMTREEAAKKYGLEPGDKMLLFDEKGNQFWYSYEPEDPSGRRDSAPVDEEPVHKFKSWRPPSQLISSLLRTRV